MATFHVKSPNGNQYDIPLPIQIDSCPTGTVVSYAKNAAPTGWLLCDGSAVSRTTYAELFAVIGTTYGAGDGSTTFNLPNLTDKFIEGGATVGTVKAAGLPNIKGQGWNIMGKSTSDWSGAFYSANGSKLATTSGNDAGGAMLYFDASRSNSIYGNSSTVQPPALTMRYIIKY